MMVIVGTDAHKGSHTIVAVDAAGAEIGSVTVAATTDGHLRAVQWAAQLKERYWAIEDCRALSRRLEGDLLGVGERVVRVPPKMMARARATGRGAGKSDPIDALAVGVLNKLARFGTAGTLPRRPISPMRPIPNPSAVAAQLMTQRRWSTPQPAADPGIATNLLTERLRRMEGDGIVRRLDGTGSGSYALTDAGEGIRTAIEELGMWGVRMAHTVGPVAPAVHERSTRAIAMAMQSILVRAGDALPAETHIVELDIEGEPVEIVLGPRPSVTARPSMRPDARLRSTAKAISGFLLGSPADGTTFEHSSGDPESTHLLIGALGGAD